MNQTRASIKTKKKIRFAIFKMRLLLVGVSNTRQFPFFFYNVILELTGLIWNSDTDKEVRTLSANKALVLLLYKDNATAILEDGKT